MNWYLAVLKKYAVFSGRAQRKEYWMFYLFNFLFMLGLSAVDKLIGMSLNGRRVDLLSAIYSLAVLVPLLAVAVRRFHDIGKNGGWVLFYFCAIFSCSIAASLLVAFNHLWTMLLSVLLLFAFSLSFILFLARDGQPGENKYGPNPKGVQK